MDFYLNIFQNISFSFRMRIKICITFWYFPNINKTFEAFSIGRIGLCLLLSIITFPSSYESGFRQFQLENVLRTILRSLGSWILSFFISFPLLLLTNHISQSAQTFCFTWFSTPIKKPFPNKKLYSFYISIIKNLKQIWKENVMITSQVCNEKYVESEWL